MDWRPGFSLARTSPPKKLGWRPGKLFRRFYSMAELRNFDSLRLGNGNRMVQPCYIQFNLTIVCLYGSGLLECKYETYIV